MNRRESLIREGLNKWWKADCKGILNYATGVGKTFGGIIATEEFVKRHKDEYPTTVLWVSPTTTILENTKAEFRKFKKTALLKNVKFICYASLKKEEKKRFPLIVYDEVHHLTSDKRMASSKKIASKATLMLSASLSWIQIRTLSVHGDVVHKLSINDVLDEGFVAPFTIVNFGIKLTHKEQSEYNKLTKNIEYVWSAYRKQSWKSIGERTRMLYSAKQKIATIRKMVELFPDDYGIIFTMEKKYSEEIAKSIGDQCVFIHSGLSNSERSRRLKSYSDGRTGIRLISTPKILDEGVTIPRLSYGILASRCSQERQFIQSLGRLLRTDVPGKHAIVIRLFAKDTVEEKWVNESQKEFKTITVYDFTNLKKVLKRAKKN